MLLARLADLLRLPWIEIVDGRGAYKKRDPERHSVAETVEQGEHRQQPILGHNVERLRHRFDVRHDVVLAEHDALWVSRAAAGEDDGRHLVRPVLAEAEDQPL